jgi:hypothetical protein
MRLTCEWVASPEDAGLGKGDWPSKVKGWKRSRLARPCIVLHRSGTSWQGSLPVRR